MSQRKDFESEELELVIFNHLFSKKIKPQDKNVKLDTLNIKETLTLDDLIINIQADVERHIKDSDKPFNILICGVGISGKSTIRSLIAKELNERIPDRIIIQIDEDYQEIPSIIEENKINVRITENVHGLDSELIDDAKNYNLIIEVAPSSEEDYLRNLIERGLGWLKTGNLDLTAPDRQFSEDPQERIAQTARVLNEQYNQAKEWYEEQLSTLLKLKNQGVKTINIFSSEITNAIYGHDRNLGSIDINQPFQKSLKDLFDKS